MPGQQDIQLQSNSNDDDVGPMPPPPVKKKKVLQHESLYLQNLPCTDQYETSLMHRDIVNFVFYTKTDFLITTSIDGHVKFWKKSTTGIDFVKHFRSHLGVIVAGDVSYDGLSFATTSVDKGLKVFDVVNFDMINMFKLDYLPNTICWMYQTGQAQSLLACSEKESNKIHLYDGRGGTDLLITISTLHSVPTHIMRYNPDANVTVSVDEKGMIEYWTPDVDNEEGFTLPNTPLVNWKYKSETDLYEFKKNRVHPTSLVFSPDYTKFVTFEFKDRQLRIFQFNTGKMLRKYDESLEIVTENQKTKSNIHTFDDMEFGRRLAIEREIEKIEGGQASTVNAVFDESGYFLLYPTLLGIKVLNIYTNQVSHLIGKGETNRFMNLVLYQGAPKKKSRVTVEMAASDNSVLKEAETMDPTIFCTAYKKNRFYSFSRREPDTASGQIRDVFNEKPSREEQTVAAATVQHEEMGTSFIIHTTFGDIYIKIYPEFAPKACKNFVELAKRGYYEKNNFHRCIKGFMIQTGDPLNDGTGGQSMWGTEFEDEFHSQIKHDQPYMISMANCGPNTNGSQFFITVAATPWLDNKHTVFGRCTGGMDVVHRIENAKCDRFDRPKEPITIISIEAR
ncbi:hypothetical protein BC833DRAFT_607054 [Globomyces pollinis-pini]|nr:hypothetical protein BC833DRAFT_607054 [Globomyces pollinis-pini]